MSAFLVPGKRRYAYVLRDTFVFADFLAVVQPCQRETYSSVNDDILSSEEECSLPRIQSIWNLLKEKRIIRPIKMLPCQPHSHWGTYPLNVICDSDLACDKVIQQ